jgi:hypothetical protein
MLLQNFEGCWDAMKRQCRLTSHSSGRRRDLTMAQLCLAVSRHMLKEGKALSASDFRQHQALLAADARMAAK